MKTKHFFWLYLTAFLVALTSCEREWDNLWDEKSSLEPNDWAPSDFKITINSTTSVKLTWQDNSNGEEGFKIDRKVNEGSWEIEFATLSANQTSFADNSVNWQTNLYMYRVYAFYAQYNSSTIESAISWPEVTTTSASNITTTSATSGGNITIQGNYSIIERGVCYGTAQNPDLSGPHLTSGSGPGTFTTNITGLTPLTTYHIRAYATTNFGTVYGSDVYFNTSNPGIGDSYAGGIVFYVNGTHGLVCAESDQSSGAQWGCYGTTIGGTGTAVGTGDANTSAIVSGCSTAGIAARICYDLTLNGYNDWFLPSKDELNLMYLNLKVAGIGGFAADYYWSSSEYSANYAWTQSFSLGYQYGYYKGSTKRVRAVRAF